MNVARAIEDHFEFHPSHLCEVSLVRCFAKWNHLTGDDEKYLHKTLLSRGCSVENLECKINYPNGIEVIKLMHYVGVRIKYSTLKLDVFDARRVHFPYTVLRQL